MCEAWRLFVDSGGHRHARQRREGREQIDQLKRPRRLRARRVLPMWRAYQQRHASREVIRACVYVEKKAVLTSSSPRPRRRCLRRVHAERPSQWKHQAQAPDTLGQSGCWES